MIPYGRQDISQNDIEAVIEVLKSDFLTQGPVVPKFEEKVADYVGAKYALAVNSATSALHVACLSLGLGINDWLWTSPVTFVASANCGLYCGARVDFVDIDPISYNLCPEKLEMKLILAEKEGRLPKVLVAVHLSGQSCDMRAIGALSDRYGFKVIEDASHAIGGKYQKDYIGSCYYSDICVFSFHPVKIVTTCEGGMALTNDALLAHKMELLRSHGINRDVSLMSHESHGPWYYQQICLGFNYRMTEVQAALGISQMDRLSDFVCQRNSLARRYDELLAHLPLVTPWHHPDGYSARHLYIIRLDLEHTKKTHREIFLALREGGVGVNLHYIPVHIQPWYTKMGFLPDDFPNAMAYYSEAISIPLYATLDECGQDQVVSVLSKVLAA